MNKYFVILAFLFFLLTLVSGCVPIEDTEENVTKAYPVSIEHVYLYAYPDSKLDYLDMTIRTYNVKGETLTLYYVGDGTYYPRFGDHGDSSTTVDTEQSILSHDSYFDF